MKALGMIETLGLVGAIEAADVALKTSEVEIVNRHIIKGGIVTVELSGDVGAIKVAIEAGSEAARRLGVFVSSHVIARPDEMVSKMLEEESIRTVDEMFVEEREETETKEMEAIETLEILEDNLNEKIKGKESKLKK